MNDEMDLCILDIDQFTILAFIVFFSYRAIYQVLAVFSDDEKKREYYSNKTTNLGPIFILGAVIALYVLSCQS
ncbi:MAG: hypothetical protein JXR16_01710 [Bermanella sp.]